MASLTPLKSQLNLCSENFPDTGDLKINLDEEHDTIGEKSAKFNIPFSAAADSGEENDNGGASVNIKLMELVDVLAGAPVTTDAGGSLVKSTGKKIW